VTDEKDRDAHTKLENKLAEVTEYFTRLRRAGRLEQSQLELWLQQLQRKLKSKPVKPKGDEIIYEQNVEPGEKFQE